MTTHENTGFLYPFIESEETDATSLLDDLAASARGKAAESARLQQESLDEYAPVLTEAGTQMADRFLRGGLAADDAGAAIYVAAALQVYFTCAAARLQAEDLRLLEERGLCPCCGSPPVAGVVTAGGTTPGMRYLHCSLCSTAWNHVRAVCITCGGTRHLALQAIDGDAGLVKAETCGECHTYAKLLYQIHDMQADPHADDLASFGLDILVAEAGFARHAQNPLLLL